MIHRLLLITLGNLTLLNFSPSSLAARVEESKENGPPQKIVKTEETQEQETFFPLTSLPLTLFQRALEFLPPRNVLQLAQVSKYCLESVSSRLNLELSLREKILTEEDFINRFGENGFYKKAQCLDLSCSSFHKACLKHLPKTLKALKLERINKPGWGAYGFTDESTMRNEIIKTLDGKTLPKLKFLDISDNGIGAEGAKYIAKNLTSLTYLDISGTGLGVEGARIIGENLKSLTYLSIASNEIGEEVVEELDDQLPECEIWFEE